jgi:hypothetical protein
MLLPGSNRSDLESGSGPAGHAGAGPEGREGDRMMPRYDRPGAFAVSLAGGANVLMGLATLVTVATTGALYVAIVVPLAEAMGKPIGSLPLDPVAPLIVQTAGGMGLVMLRRWGRVLTLGWGAYAVLMGAVALAVDPRPRVLATALWGACLIWLLWLPAFRGALEQPGHRATIRTAPSAPG